MPSETFARSSRTAVALAIPALLCVAVVAQTGRFRASSSVTYDETFYLGVGVRALSEGRLEPDLWKHGTAPLPILVEVVPAAWRAGVAARAEAWKGIGDRALVAGPRLVTTLTTLVPLVVLAFGWLHARRGPFAATVGAGLLACSPALLAHASLATSDAAFASLATLAALAIGRHLAARSPRSLAVAAVATGLAFSAKYTGVLLVVVYLVARLADLVREARAEGNGSSRRVSLASLEAFAFLTIGLATTWACHGFQVEGTWHGLPVPTFVEAFKIQILHSRLGHPSYYLGERSLMGWRSYHPFTMLVKSTVPELILSAAGCGLAIRSLRRYRAADRERTTLALFAVLLAIALIRSPISIGHRYTLPLYPPIVLLTIDSLAAALANRPARGLWGAALLGGQLATSLLAAPDYLAYFNPIAGRPEDAWKLLADSNIDWGQGLPALRELMDREGLKYVVLDYFGTASPEEYGVFADPPWRLRRPIEEYDAVAVSVTKLHSVYPRQGEPRRVVADLYRELRGLAPTYQAGRSILVYDLRRAEARAAFLASVDAMRRPPAQAAARETRRAR